MSEPLFVASFEVVMEAQSLDHAECCALELAAIIADESITVVSVDVIVSEAPPKYQPEDRNRAYQRGPSVSPLTGADEAKRDE